MKVFGHDYNDPWYSAYVKDGQPLPAVGEDIILRDWDGSLQHPMRVVAHERGWQDEGWFCLLEPFGKYEFFDPPASSPEFGEVLAEVT